jgi:hypothetical protein
MALPTLLDIAIQNGCDPVVGLIEEAVKNCPEVKLGSARTIKGINYKTLVRTSLPTVGFRNGNEGTAVGKSNYENRLFECFIFNPPWECDKAIADAHEDGAQAYIAREGIGMMEASFISLGAQFYYGTNSDAKGFPGLSQVVASSMILDAAGSTANTGSSVYAVRWGEQHVQWLYGLNGALNLSDVTEVRLADGSGNPYMAYHQEILARPGLQVGSTYSVARIKNLTADNGKGLTDSLLYQLFDLFPAGTAPDAIFMSRRSRQQLRTSRTATNATGSPAPIPTEFEGVPIYPTDSLKNIEAIEA